MTCAFCSDDASTLLTVSKGQNMCMKYKHYENFGTDEDGILYRTLEFISRKYWWETLRYDVTKFIKECEDCAKRKTGNKIKAPLGETLVATEFLDVSLDISGPLPVTERGNRYLLTFVNHFTRFCEAIPIERQDTETIAREFVCRIVTQFGVPRKLLTDR